MRTGNHIRPSVPPQELHVTTSERQYRFNILQSRKLRAAALAVTLLLPAACGSNERGAPDTTDKVVPAGAAVRLDAIDNSLCKPKSPEAGVTSQLLDAFVLTLARAMRPSHAVERSQSPDDRRPAVAATKPTGRPHSPSPSASSTTPPAPSPTTTSAPQPSATTAYPNPSRTTTAPRPLPVPTISSSQPEFERQQRPGTGIAPPVSATAIPLPGAPEGSGLVVERCENTRAFIEVSATDRFPLNNSPNITDPDNKAWAVDYDDFIHAAGPRNPQETYTLTSDLPILGPVL